MQHHHSIDNCQLKSAWITIGSFDGIHLGHQYLIRQMVQNAHENDTPAVIITFFPHPAIYLQKITNPFYLTSPEEKLEYLEYLGVDYVFTLDFNQDLASMRAQAFIEKLSKHQGMRSLWVGQGFALGKGREGNVSFLNSISPIYQFDVHIVDPIQVNGANISSTFIRGLIREGKIKAVKPVLGRNYSIRGKVVPGDHRGRLLGFPTANLQPTYQRLIPAYGIYATRLKWEGSTYPSVTNVGIRPTFQTDDPTPRIETHILDFNHNIYNADIEVEFIEFLRPEAHYTDLQDLLNQICLDIEKSREILSYEP